MSIYTRYPITTNDNIYLNTPPPKKKKKPEISHLHKYSDPLLNTLLRQLWLQVFLGVMLQTLKLCQVGWGASVHNDFQVFPEMFNWVEARALDGLL